MPPVNLGSIDAAHIFAYVGTLVGSAVSAYFARHAVQQLNGSANKKTGEKKSKCVRDLMIELLAGQLDTVKELKTLSHRTDKLEQRFNDCQFGGQTKDGTGSTST